MKEKVAVSSEDVDEAVEQICSFCLEEDINPIVAYAAMMEVKDRLSYMLGIEEE